MMHTHLHLYLQKHPANYTILICHHGDQTRVLDSFFNGVLNAEVMKYLNILKGVRRVFFRTLNTHWRPMWKKAFDRSYICGIYEGWSPVDEGQHQHQTKLARRRRDFTCPLFLS
ncbi:hypothetical protein Hdeb2414_s0001g00011341 [Helianthus debilis subsp. tardiflorus]